MQSLDIISVNFWSIFVSLCNLVILFLILKKFLFKPVEKMFKQRQDAVDSKYSEAENYKNEAENLKNSWDEKISTAKTEADDIIKNANDTAKRQSDRILSDAKDEAQGILNRAKTDAELEKQKATDGIRKEIADVSALISEKMIEREINKDDHKKLIDSFIDKIGEDNDDNE